MLFCPFAREVWSELKKDFDIHLNRNFFTSPKTWLVEFLSRSGEIQATILAVTCWHLWDTRNKLWEEGGLASPFGVTARIKVYVDMIAEHLFKYGTTNSRETYRAVPWSPPPVDLIQFNVDAALFASSHRMGAGIVARNHLDTFVAAMGDSLPSLVQLELAEALAIRSALSWANEEGLKDIVVATDCLSAVQRINSTERDRSCCGPVILDIKKLVSSFNKCTVRFVSRVQNFAAHYLARSSEFACKSVWRGMPPESIRETICIDSMFR
jgi:hypothetical protein